MKEENKKIVLERWFKKAQEDELNADSILRHRDGTPGVVCFLAQQLAEKYLKACLISFDLELLKVHDLLRLISVLEVSASEIKILSNEANLLNQFYIETRYVGDYPDFSWEDAEKAYEAAKKIKDFVLREITEK